MREYWYLTMIRRAWKRILTPSVGELEDAVLRSMAKSRRTRSSSLTTRCACRSSSHKRRSATFSYLIVFVLSLPLLFFLFLLLPDPTDRPVGSAVHPDFHGLLNVASSTSNVFE